MNKQAEAANIATAKAAVQKPTYAQYRVMAGQHSMDGCK
jgi:hypothetical protein